MPSDLTSFGAMPLRALAMESGPGSDLSETIRAQERDPDLPTKEGKKESPGRIYGQGLIALEESRGSAK